MGVVGPVVHPRLIGIKACGGVGRQCVAVATPVYMLRACGPAEIGRAWPLVQARLPSVNFLQWQRFATALVDGDPSTDAGIVLAERAGAVRGLFGFRRVPDLAGDGLLLVRPVILLEMISADALWHVLEGAVADIAGRLGCGATCVPTPQGEEPLAAALADSRPKLSL